MPVLADKKLIAAVYLNGHTVTCVTGDEVKIDFWTADGSLSVVLRNDGVLYAATEDGEGRVTGTSPPVALVDLIRPPAGGNEPADAPP